MPVLLVKVNTKSWITLGGKEVQFGEMGTFCFQLRGGRFDVTLVV